MIAVFGQVMFKDVKDVGKLARELSLLESKVKLYRRGAHRAAVNPPHVRQHHRRRATRSARKRRSPQGRRQQLPGADHRRERHGQGTVCPGHTPRERPRLHPFVRINCAAIPRTCSSPNCFGYEKGASQGAKAEGKPGKFELAHQGTHLLDEIGDLPIEMQPKLLRAIEDKEFERVGRDTRVVRSDFRVIAATNQHLETMLASGSFRKDLFYRLNVIPCTSRPCGSAAATSSSSSAASWIRWHARRPWRKSNSTGRRSGRCALATGPGTCGNWSMCRRASPSSKGPHSRGGTALLH